METDGTLNPALLSVLRQIQEMIDSEDFVVYWTDVPVPVLLTFADQVNGLLYHNDSVVDGIDLTATDPGWVKEHIRIYEIIDHCWEG